MTFIKRNFGSKTFLVVGIGLLCSIAVYLIYVFFRQKQIFIPLTGTLGRLEERISKHPAVVRYQTKQQFDAYVFSTDTDAVFTIHPSVFDNKRAETNNLLSGHVHIHTERSVNHKEREKGNANIDISGNISGIIDDYEEVDIIVEASMSLRTYEDDMYVRLDDLSLEQNERELTTLLLRDIVLHRFVDTWIRLDPEQYTPLQLQFFSPHMVMNFLDTDISKIRLLDDEESPEILYTLSGHHLAITGSWLDTKNNTMTITLPHISSTVVLENNDTPYSYSIDATQDNGFQGTFEGSSNFAFDRRLAQHRIVGELIYPAGIRSNITHDRFIRKASGLNLKSTPKKRIERSDVRRIRDEEQKQDVTLN